MSFRIFDHLVVGPLACNCFIVGDDETNEAIVIDPGGDADLILASLKRHSLTLVLQIATHAHFDHVLAADEIREATGAPFLLHESDLPVLEWLQASMQFFLGTDGPPPPEVDRSPSDTDTLKVGTVELEVLHTPGHSLGSISLVVPGEAVFAGDTLMAGAVGRTDLPGGDFDQLEKSIKQRLFVLGDLPVFSGHGPPTTIDREKVSNPFVGSSPGFWVPGT